MKPSPKQFKWITIFVVYQFFMPFILVNCGHKEDIPYDRTVGEGQDKTVDCQGSQFLVADCVDEAKAEQDANNPKPAPSESEEEPETPAEEGPEDPADPPAEDSDPPEEDQDEV